ncbi:MAG: carboxypeptidase-like regulatory domain-containing protein [Actinomycetota bacterium]|nr:carboxypeptidase-like regulatory domain-containing protein [Actinomycetota bacterium]
MLAAVSTASVLVAALALSSGPASASTAPSSPAAVAVMQRSWSYVPDYAGSPKIDTGIVVNAAGHPVSGATVLVFPVSRTPVKAGSVIQPVARAISDSNGEFTIRLPSSQDGLLADTSSEGTFLNLNVIAFYPGGVASWFVPVKAGANAPSVRLTLKQVRTTGSTSASPAVCTIITTKDKTPKIEVGFKDSGDSALAWASYQYTTNTSTTTGAALSTTSSTAGFSADGSTTQSAGGSYTWPRMAGAGVNELLGSGLYYDQEWACSDVPEFWRLFLNSIGSAAGSPGASRISAGDCVTQEHGAVDTYTRGTQSTWSQGVNLEAVGININLSSQDGWDGTAYLTFATGSVSLPICGVHNKPNATNPSAGLLAVH